MSDSANNTSYHRVGSLPIGTIIRVTRNGIKELGVLSRNRYMGITSVCTIKNGQNIAIQHNTEVEVIGHASDAKFAMILIASAGVE